VLVILRHSPHGSGLAGAGLDSCLAAAAFGQPLALLFMGAGVLQLLAGQHGSIPGVRDVGALLASLPHYNIARIYAEAESAGRFGIDLAAAPVEVTAVDDAALRDLIERSSVVLGF